jgi:hypothetical protein
MELYAPKTFRLYGTNDFKNYDVLLDIADRKTQQEFNVGPTSAYSSFRLAINKIEKDQFGRSGKDTMPVVITKWELNGQRDDTTDVVDFSSPFYKNNVNKCRWSRKCNSSWEGIDQLCS